MQGKDPDKVSWLMCLDWQIAHISTQVQAKLEKAQQAISGNEKDYQNYVRALKETTIKWNTEWKSFCDVSLSLCAMLSVTDCCGSPSSDHSRP